MLFCSAFLLFLLGEGYCQNLVYTSGYSNQVYSFLLDVDSGLLSEFGKQDVDPNLTFVEAYNAGSLYAAHEVTEYDGLGATGAVSRWLKGRDTFGKPIYKRFETLSSNGKGTCHVRVRPDPGLLHAANYVGGSFTSFKLSKSGEIVGQVYNEYFGKGSNVVPDRQEDSHPHGSWDFGPFVYVADLGSDKIWHYQVGPDSTLEKADPPFTTTPPGFGPRHMAFHDDLKLAYVVFELQSFIGVYSVSPSGALTEKFMVTLMPEPSSADYAAEIEISPSQKHLYVSNRGNGAILAFEILPDGNLDLLQVENVDGATPRHFKIHPNGEIMLVALQENTLLSYKIDQESGLLRKVDSKSCPNTPTVIGLLQL